MESWMLGRFRFAVYPTVRPNIGYSINMQYADKYLNLCTYNS